MADPNLTVGAVRIYALTDPRTGEHRYVGQTRMRLCARRACHVFDAKAKRSASDKTEWVAGLLADGLRPGIVALEVVAAAHAVAAETRWIEALRACGSPLLNSYEPDLSLPRPASASAKIAAFRSSFKGWRHKPETKAKIGRAGVANSAARLDDQKVMEIRRRQSAGEAQAAIARSMGVSNQTISDVVRRRKWAHVT